MGGCRPSPSCFPPTPSIGSIWSGLESPLPPNLAPNKGQGVHSLSNQGGLSGGGIAGKSVRLKEEREDQQREVSGSWRKVRKHIFHILPRVVLPRACLARDLPGPHSSLTGRAGIEISLTDEAAEAQRGSGVFLGSHSEGGPRRGQTPVVALASLLALPPHRASDPLGKSTKLCVFRVLSGCAGMEPQELEMTSPNISSQTSSLPPSARGSADSELPLK